MKILFFGNFEGPGNDTGERPDERHQAEALQELGHEVTTFPRDQINAKFKNRTHDPLPECEPDIILVAKWGQYLKETIKYMKDIYKAPLVYWCWDYMRRPNGNFPTTHLMMLEECNYYLSGEKGLEQVYKDMGVNYIYYNWDAYDGRINPEPTDYKYDVIFPGTYHGEYRQELLESVKYRTTVFSWDYMTWREHGFKAEPGKYGKEFTQLSSQAKIILCTNWVAPSEETRGYWSNRIGKILTTGGFPLLNYVPGMEDKFGWEFPYFKGKDDIIEKIDYWLNDDVREEKRRQLYKFGREKMTTEASMKELINILNICK